MRILLPKSKFKSKIHFHFQLLSKILLMLLLITVGYILYRDKLNKNDKTNLQTEIKMLKSETENLKSEKAKLAEELEILKNEDTRKTNNELKEKIAKVETTFRLASQTLENISDARNQAVNVSALDIDLAKAVNLLSQLNYDEANNKLDAINQKVNELITAKQAQITAASAQDLPAAGSYRRQSVVTDRGNFVVSLIAEQASAVKMITDTANDDTCTDNCPINSLATYVSRNGGFAGINGTYFCPSDYPSCAGKVNSYNTLVFNARLKKYMNSDQNVYSTVAMVVQNADHSMRFMATTLEWGRDTGIIGGIANHPLLVSGGKSVVNDANLDEKSRGAKMNRGFIASKGSTLYIGVVHNASVGDSAVVLAAIGADQAINLDGGGSSALYYNGKYIVGPGRNLPNAVVLVR